VGGGVGRHGGAAPPPRGGMDSGYLKSGPSIVFIIFFWGDLSYSLDSPSRRNGMRFTDREYIFGLTSDGGAKGRYNIAYSFRGKGSTADGELDGIETSRDCAR